MSVADPVEGLKPRPTKLLLVLKIGRKQHLEQLQAGKIWCRHLTYYRDGEGGGESQPWQDPDEGVAAVLQSDRIRMIVTLPDGDEHIIDAENGLVGQVIIRRDLKVPAFCLHAIHTGEWTEREFGAAELADFKKYLAIADTMAEFGDHVLVLGPEFFERVRAACEREKISFFRGLVRYIDEKEAHGKIPVDQIGFVKLKRFAPQREFRFVFRAQEPLPDPFILDVGPLHDVSQLMTLEDFRNNCVITFDADGDPPEEGGIS